MSGHKTAGAGSPSWFKCAACRSTVNRDPKAGKYKITRTGRTRPRKRGDAVGVRHGHIMREYICGCGYRGWSAHNDLDSDKYPIVIPLTWAQRLAAMPNDELLANVDFDGDDAVYDEVLRRMTGDTPAWAKPSAGDFTPEQLARYRKG